MPSLRDRLHLPAASILTGYLVAVAGVLVDHPDLVASAAGKLGAVGAVAAPVALAFCQALVRDHPRPAAASPGTAVQRAMNAPVPAPPAVAADDADARILAAVRDEAAHQTAAQQRAAAFVPDAPVAAVPTAPSLGAAALATLLDPATGDTQRVPIQAALRLMEAERQAGGA